MSFGTTFSTACGCGFGGKMPSTNMPPARATKPASTTKKKIRIIEAPETVFPDAQTSLPKLAIQT